MNATEQSPTHAMLVRGADGIHLRPACTTRACAERSITFAEGGHVVGVTELYPEPIPGMQFWERMQRGNVPMTAADLATPPARDARDDEISMLRDALDHIARSAHQSRSQTVRIRWIEARANGALEGKPYVRGQFREPKNGIAEFERMQSEILRMKAAQPVARVPLGMVMVPREPTEAMLNAPNTIIQTYGARLIWQRMVAAAPAIEADDVPDPATNWADADAADYPGAVVEQEQRA
ncbi:hypothetical protein [Lysobacter capsici]|uniref:hypothetical protein n=1 Tax=Lysobacter capsici TaxID=435897 RepID=UPI001C008205|nr:hypothetical protein [Lysobacter capsici]QWF19260.1 hypothetical protein KME82_11235 [Lysobacter capsici]